MSKTVFHEGTPLDGAERMIKYLQHKVLVFETDLAECKKWIQELQHDPYEGRCLGCGYSPCKPDCKIYLLLTRLGGK